MNRRSITVVIMVILCAVGFAYGQGWLDWSHTGAQLERDKVGTHQAPDQQKMKNDAVQVTPQATEPAAMPKK
jgi:hypothetical protein